MNNTNILELTNMDWGSITPEFSRENKLVHVFNHFISNQESVERTINFIVGRIIWCNTYLKNNFEHNVVIDDAGQSVTDNTREYIKNSLKGYAAKIKFMSEEE